MHRLVDLHIAVSRKSVSSPDVRVDSLIEAARFERCDGNHKKRRFRASLCSLEEGRFVFIEHDGRNTCGNPFVPVLGLSWRLPRKGMG